jgi:siroheme synthase (precorrin-2 oxidase/ferrochelatase)
MALTFSGTIPIDGAALPYTIDASAYFCGHDVRVLVRSPTPDAERVRAAATELTDLIVAASAPPITESITPLREDPSEYIVKIMVPMKGPVWDYANALQSYIESHLAAHITK